MDSKTNSSMQQSSGINILECTRRKFFKTTRLIFSLFLSVFIFAPSLSSAADSSESIFKWSMPDRLLENFNFPGYDANSSVPVYDPNVQMLPPGGWLVNFDVCSNSVQNIVSFDWYVDGEPVAKVDNCLYDHRFLDEGVYEVTVNIIDDNGVTKTINQEITVQDWLIIGLGDSYGSGEGNPIEPVSTEALKEYSELANLAAQLEADIQIAKDKLPGFDEAQRANQKKLDDSLITRNDAKAKFDNLTTQKTRVTDIYNRVLKDQAVATAKNNVNTAKQYVSGWQSQVNDSQKRYDNCNNFIDCSIKKSRLNGDKKSLQAAKNDQITAERNLLATQDKAVLKYSTISSIKTFNALKGRLNSLTTEVAQAKSVHETAIKSQQEASDSLQKSIAAIDDLQNEIVKIQKDNEEATLNSKQVLLDSMPIWTRTAPSWGTPEPDYGQIVLNGQMPGEALRCHRSMISGQARAALKLEQSDPHTSVTFLHLACSGASIDSLTGSYEGIDIESAVSALANTPADFGYTGMPALEPIQAQIATAAKKIEGREVDAIIISIGASDIMYSDIINECILGQPCHDDVSSEALPSKEITDALTLTVDENCRPTSLYNQVTGQSIETASFPFTDNCMSDYSVVDTDSGAGKALSLFNENTFGSLDEKGAIKSISLTEKFNRLKSDENTNKATLDKYFPSLDSKRIYITQYLDSTSDDVGNYCGWSPDQSASDKALSQIPGVTQSELTWIDRTVATTLHEKISNAALLQQWNYVANTGVGDDTIVSVSKQHGYCADNNWVIRLPESLMAQQDGLGMMKPNREGHKIYEQAIAEQLIQDFYPNSLAMQPRAPDKRQLGIPLPIDVQVASNSNNLGSLAAVYLLLLSITTCLLRRA